MVQSLQLYHHTASYKQIIVTFLFLLTFPAGYADTPPKEKGDFRKPELIELTALDSTFKLDIRYATPNNFTGQQVYSEARAFLQIPAAQALVQVNEELKKLGYGLVIFDGYRPWSITKFFWDITPVQNRKFVANPSKGSRHNRGCAVDVTLYEITTGKEVQMTSEYDEPTERSAPTYTGGTQEQRKMRDLLLSEMTKYGFTVEESEWWHYDYKDWKYYPILDIPFSEIKQEHATAHQ